nr:ArsR family transcriptional regulator [Natronococcus sp. AD5]
MIPEELDDKGRNIATNLAASTYKNRKNIHTRLPVLEDYGLVRKIGPAERSGLYEITSLGRSALEHRNKYDHIDDFGSPSCNPLCYWTKGRSYRDQDLAEETAEVFKNE